MSCILEFKLIDVISDQLVGKKKQIEQYQQPDTATQSGVQSVYLGVFQGEIL